MSGRPGVDLTHRGFDRSSVERLQLACQPVHEAYVGVAMCNRFLQERCVQASTFGG